MTETFSSAQRTEYLQNMANAHFDVLIIGGGITGAGIALDAASRGLKTALVEMQDFAKRYIQSFDQACPWRITLFEAI